MWACVEIYIGFWWAAAKGPALTPSSAKKQGGSEKTRVENASRGAPSTVWSRRGPSQLLVVPHQTREGVFVMSTA